ncbi:MAG: D-tyrosyl-tRNA(Tyr) deacylase [Planctomycetota bacterium]|nr:MAG: D-tyrosyl-tRNA(Tyr) deacylase [Planctomycetota bacterium]
MRALIQRVHHAEVVVDDDVVGKIDKGLLVFLGVEPNDLLEDVDWLSGKLARLRIFKDNDDLMNLSVNDIDGNILVVSQFTLFASTKKGNRPSFTQSAKPDYANEMYQKFLEELTKLTGKKIEKGIFGADMKVSLLNDGPVTIMIDSKNKE